VKPGVCAYCGKASTTLEPDHVPPKTLFAAPRPNNLITVPSCRRCHKATSKNDEYFRLVLSTRDDVFDHPDVSGGVLKAALRSLALWFANTRPDV
jgi:HNH endonuclease